MFRILVLMPFAFVILQTLALIFGQATMGEMIITSQLVIVVFEMRRCFWSERDYIESEKILFRRKTGGR